jgi:hypothetical protein
MLACVGLVACSTTNGPDPGSRFPDQCAPAACATGATVSSTDELVAMVDATPAWTVEGPYTTGCLPASDNIVVTGTANVPANGIAVPAFCTAGGGAGCRQQVMFEIDGQVPGVDCVGPEAWFDFTLCAGINVHDTTVRLRMLQLDIHPSSFGPWAPIVEVIGACETACEANAFACDATNTCWQTARDQCAYCFGGTNQECACWNGTGFDADGTSCDYYESGDVITSGTCEAGTCVFHP